MSAHRVSLIALLLAAPAVLAQSAGGHAGHHAAPAPAAAAPAMDHGEMQMQGGAAPGKLWRGHLRQHAAPRPHPV